MSAGEGRWRTWLRRLAPDFLRARLPYSKTYRRIAASPDRQILTEEILPEIARRCGTVLWVGVRRYTAGYPALLEQGGGRCWTLEIDPDHALWGRAGRHVTGDLLGAHELFEPGQFSAVLCNGVFGFGVDSPAAQTAALEAMAAVTRPGGWLLLGWNSERMADPLDLPAFARSYEPAGLGDLPARRAVAGVGHVYDLARRRIPEG